MMSSQNFYVILGYSGSGKTTLARIMEEGFKACGRKVLVFDSVESRDGSTHIERELEKRFHGRPQVVIATSLEPLPQRLMVRATRVIEISRTTAFTSRLEREAEGFIRGVVRRVRESMGYVGRGNER